MESLIKLRISNGEASYGGDLIDGAKILKLFGDAATEILILVDGNEGLFVNYENIDFLATVYTGDYVEVRANLIKKGKTSRKMAFECYVTIRQEREISDSAASKLNPPILVCRAIGTCVVKKELQRYAESGE